METFEEFMTAMKALREENERSFAEIREQQEENAKNMAENMKGFAELRELQEKNEKFFERVEKQQEENAKSFAELHKELGGIGDSNGKFCESYFYSTLFNSMHFGGKDFDNIDKGLKRSKKLPDGKKLTGEYDVVMYNGNTIALIEVKYKVKKNHIENLKTNQVKMFKELFPQYANFDFYLGIAGLSFEDNTEKEALEQGIGILRPKGENVEIIDDNLKVY
ncbi:MAG: hypothetical protein FWF51_01740 [Chitinivibrionia bacterium]|nr:hypothetical protein [Chitinivibrionia bacterium]